MNRRRRISYYILRGGIAFVSILALLFIVWRIQLARDLNGELDAIQAAHLPTSGVELDQYYSHVPDDRNAAVKMEQAFSQLKEYSDSRSNEMKHFKVPLYDQSLSPEQVELLGDYAALNLNALDTVDRAVKIPDCHYPIDLSEGMATRLPHLQELTTVASLEEYSALLNLNAGRQDTISHTILDTLNLAHTLDHEPLIISQLVRLRIQNTAVEILEHWLNVGALQESDRTNLYRAFVAGEKTNCVALALIGERAVALPYFHLSLGDWETLGIDDTNNNVLDGRAPESGNGFLPFEWSGFYGRDELFYLQALRTNIMLEAMTLPNAQMINNFDTNIFAACERGHYIFSALLLPAAKGAFNREATGAAEIHAAQLALQIEAFRSQHGQLPKSMNELVPRFISTLPIDPFDGQPMRYHTLTNGYVIYSVGRDLHDNGGRERPPDAKSSDKTEYDITFTVHR